MVHDEVKGPGIPFPKLFSDLMKCREYRTNGSAGCRILDHVHMPESIISAHAQHERTRCNHGTVSKLTFYAGRDGTVHGPHIQCPTQ